MKTNHLDRILGHYCKIVINEPGDKKAHVVTGIIKEIDHQRQCIILQSYTGIWFLDINTIIAIKPKKIKNT